LNRLDEIIIFNSLTPDHLKEIVKIQIEEVVKRLGLKDIGFRISPDASLYLAQQGFSPLYGVRPLKRLIQSRVLNSVAELIISGKLSAGDSVVVHLQKGELAIEAEPKKRGRLSKNNVWNTNLNRRANRNIVR